MSTVDTIATPDTFADCGTGDGGSLPADPFTALRFHFGMLLGVDDFEVEQGFHHGKQRLHNAWLHRDGVVWGLGVEVAEGEVRVRPGLALDGAGRELHLDDAACVDVTAWYQQHAADVGGPGEGGDVEFDAYVIARYATCPMRPVPALAEPCAGSTSETAYSRTYETVDLRLVPGPPPDAAAAPYHRLRVLFGLEAPTLPADQSALDARSAALAATDRAAAFLAAFDELAVLDTIDLAPAAEPDEPATRYPALEDTGVVLARITGIRLVPGGDDGTGWTLVDGSTVDYSGRRSLLATQAIQELLCGPEGVVSGGATFDPAQVAFDTGASTITLVATAPLDPDTVTKDQFAVSTLDGGWSAQKVKKAELDAAGTTVTLTLDALPAGKTIRVLAYGTGPTPILGADLAPLGTGADFVLMKGS
jgi:hypothetical protein